MTNVRRQLLGCLAEYHYLRTRDFYEILAISTPHAQRGLRRALRLLARSGLVVRARHAIDKPDDPFLRYEHCYRLSRSGCRVIGGGHAAVEKSPASLDHELLITDIHVALKGRVPPSLAIYWRQTNLKQTVHPDALFAITDTTRPRDNSTFYYFLEVEYSRQGHYRAGDSGLLTKLRRYVEYRRTEACRKEWKYFCDFTVVVVLRTRERQENLLRMLKGRLPTKAIWITTIDDVARDALGPIFRSSNDETFSILSRAKGADDVRN